jgi:transposase InsO family protein
LEPFGPSNGLMGWKETCAMEERIKFVHQWQKDEWNFAELCREFGVSRKTGYKWLERYDRDGIGGLADQSRAPHEHPNAVDGEIERAILETRSKHPRWGPAKLRVILQRRDPDVAWPAVSTIGKILRRAGVTAPRKKHLRVPRWPDPLVGAEGPNQVWCADYKGYFHCADGTRCDPLTITDRFSRYLMRCQVVDGVEEKYARLVFEAAFREYGLPQVIRTDNGSPFATVALAGLSELAVWWIQLGIRPERIVPGKPQQNGAHERMHRTLLEATAQPPQRSRASQQRAFDRFRHEFNHERPHEALQMRVPAEVYQHSDRAYPNRLPPVEYGNDRLVRTVGSCGRIRWSGERIFITKALGNKPIGLEGVSDGLWRLWYSFHPIGWLDERSMQVEELNTRPSAPAAEATTPGAEESLRPQGS